jgi:hypothetical protein
MNLSILLLLFLVGSATIQSPAVAVGSIAKTSAITSLSYQLTVTGYPQVNSSAGFEFHAGMLSGDNSTFIKSTVSYGCQIAAHKACFPPFLNRFIFYVSVIDANTRYRTQYPAQGYALTSGSNYTVTFTKASCLFNIQAWTFSVSNSSKTFSTKVCMLNQNFIYPVAGMLEIHNVTLCDSQLPPSHIFTQTGLHINGQTISGWSLIPTAPYIDCNFTDAYKGSDISVAWG